MNKRWKRLILYALLPIVAIGGFLYWFTWTGSTDDIIRVADQFKVPSTWKLVSDHADPPRTICLDGSCPGLSRNWTTNDTVAEKYFTDIIKQSGWSNISLKPGCLDDEYSTAKTHICNAHGKIEKYNVQIYIERGIYTSPTDKSTRISLHLYQGA